MKPFLFACLAGILLLASCKAGEKSTSLGPKAAKRTVVYSHPTVYRELGGFTYDTTLKQR
jgi:hypothetical protein